MTLHTGDEVAIIGPASQLRGTDRELLAKAVSVLESWGLRVRVNVSQEHHFYLAGADSVRAEQLRAALSNEGIRAIFCLRGGYGSARLLKYLGVVEHVGQKFFVGYSDVTTLHGAVAHLWPQVDLVYGPNVATRQFLDDSPDGESTRKSLRELLFDPNRRVSEKIEFIRPGVAEGRLTGGCLSMLTSLLGTSYAHDTDGTILFIEDVGEAPYRIDRMLTHLRNAGKLAGVRGIVFGEMRNCNDPYNDLRLVISDLFKDDSFPVGFGLRSGHGASNLSLHLGAHAKLDSSESTFRM
jgi:muramoyltetrapeptide carboxypeptidase